MPVGGTSFIIGPNTTSSNPPPDLTLYTPQISGLTVTLNGVTHPGGGGTSIARIGWNWGDSSTEDHWFPANHTYAQAGDYTV